MVLLLGLVLIVSGCLGGGGDAPAVEKETIAGAIENVSTYSFQTNLSSDAELADAPEGAPGAGTSVTRTRNVTGAVDLETETLSLEAVSTTEFSGMGPQAPPSQPQEARQRVFISEGTIYVGDSAGNDSAANGTAGEVPTRWVRETDQRAIDRYWETQEPMRALRTVLEAAEVGDTRTGSVDGRSATGVDLAINASQYRRTVVRDLGGNGLGSVSIGGGPRSRTEVRNVSITVWTEDDGTPLRTDTSGTFAVTQISPRGNQTIVRRFDATTRYTGYGEPVTVSIPDEALNAPTVTELRQNTTRTANRTTAPSDDATDEGETTDGETNETG